MNPSASTFGSAPGTNSSIAFDSIPMDFVGSAPGTNSSIAFESVGPSMGPVSDLGPMATGIIGLLILGMVALFIYMIFFLVDDEKK